MANDTKTYTKEQIRKAFEQVQGHVLHMHAYWNLFRKLYRGNAESQPVLAAVAGQVFAVLGRLLHRGVFFQFRQLLDPPRSVGRRNASLLGLLEAVAGPGYRADHGDLVALIESAEGKKTIREHVNKYIAHLDLDLLAGVAEPPAAVEILEVEAAFQSIRTFMNEYGIRFVHEPAMAYDEIAEIISEQAESLVATLRAGLDASTGTPL